MERLTIRSLKSRATPQPQSFSLRAQIDSLVTKTSRSGNPYLQAEFTDATGSLVLRIWSDSDLFKALSSLKKGAFVHLEAQWQTNDPYGVEPKDASLRELTGEERAALLHGAEELRTKQQQDYDDIVSFVESIVDPRLQALCRQFLEENEERFRRTAAARSYHHARRGGLVEHVAQMMRAADAISSVYPELNRDLLLAGVLFHDCGKLWENCYAERDFSMPHTEPGELLGHISMGMELINRVWRELLVSPDAATWQTLSPPSDEVRLHLLHLVGSHHGEYAFGAPVLPRTPEASALHYIDNLDAKLEMFAQGYISGTRLTPHIVERVRPLPANLVEPLPKFDPLELPQAD